MINAASTILCSIFFDIVCNVYPSLQTVHILMLLLCFQTPVVRRNFNRTISSESGKLCLEPPREGAEIKACDKFLHIYYSAGGVTRHSGSRCKMCSGKGGGRFSCKVLLGCRVDGKSVTI